MLRIWFVGAAGHMSILVTSGEYLIQCSCDIMFNVHFDDMHCAMNSVCSLALTCLLMCPLICSHVICMMFAMFHVVSYAHAHVASEEYSNGPDVSSWHVVVLILCLSKPTLAQG